MSDPAPAAIPTRPSPGAPPAGRMYRVIWPFVAVTGAAMAFFVYVGMLVVTIPRYVENELGAGEFGVGLTVATFAGAAILIRPVIGWAGDRYGRRRLMLVGALLAAVAGAGSAFAGSLGLLLVLRAVAGVGEAAMFVGAATIIADMAPAHRRAEAASYFSVAVFGGLGVGPVVGERLLGDDRYLVTFLAAGVVALIAALLVIAVPRRVDIDTATVVASSARPLVHRSAIWPGLVLASGIAGFSVFTAFLPEYSRSVGLGGAAALFVTYSVILTALRVLGARWPERLGAGRAVTISLVFQVAGLTAAALFATVTGLWLALVLISIGMAFVYPSLMAVVVNSVGDDERARALSSFTMFFEIGSVIGGIALGTVAELLGKRAGFAGGALVSLTGLAILWLRVVPRLGVRDRGADTSPLAVVAGE